MPSPASKRIIELGDKIVVEENSEKLTLLITELRKLLADEITLITAG